MLYRFLFQALQAVNGGFSVWTAWSECTRGCNGGIQSRNRFCNNPTPLHGGADCTGDRMMTRACNTDVCPGMTRSTFLLIFLFKIQQF